ncbi:MAG: type II secretion system F family protein [Actinomycetaceae bacterium]|nr:type II secretion system F family protein [Actinomycetaceae bacterium]
MSPIVLSVTGGAALFAGASLLLFTWWDTATYPWERVGPYVRSRQDVGPMDANRDVGTRVRRGIIALLSRLGSTTSSVERRISLAGSRQVVGDIRLAQLLGASVGMLISCAICALGLWLGTMQLWQALGLIAVFTLSGAMLRDVYLSHEAKARQKSLDRELPDVIELLALAVGSGAGILAALTTVSQRCSGAIGEELRSVVAVCQSGETLHVALTSLHSRNEVPALTRLSEALITAIDRGTPVATVLRDHARDARNSWRTELLAQGGRKEIHMMVPVVFLILPLTVLFALYPGLAALRM